jgi:hypothetical protein
MADMPEPSSPQPPAVDWNERRLSVRRSCLETSKRVVAAVGDDFCLTKVRNISPEGISLIIGRPLETGATLLVDLIHTKTNRLSRTLAVRVCWCIEHPSGDWIMGGSFAGPLTQEEMDYFLK